MMEKTTPNTLSYSTTINEKKSPQLFSFDSYIDINVNTNDLRDPIYPYQAIPVTIEIEYRTDIPEDFLWFLPWQLKNLILYGTIYEPLQKIL